MAAGPHRGWTAIVATLLIAVGCGDDEEAAVPTTTVTTTSATTAEDPATAPQPQAEADDAGTAEQQASSERKPLTVPDVLEAVLTASVDAALICDELVTENYVRTAYGAREGCIAAQKPGTLAESLNGLHVNSSAGDRATATVVPGGGPYDDVDVDVELIRDGGGWRVDSLLADVPAGP